MKKEMHSKPKRSVPPILWYGWITGSNIVVNRGCCGCPSLTLCYNRPIQMCAQNTKASDPGKVKRKFSSFFKSLVIELDKDLYGPDNHLVEVTAACQLNAIAAWP